MALRRLSEPAAAAGRIFLSRGRGRPLTANQVKKRLEAVGIAISRTGVYGVLDLLERRQYLEVGTIEREDRTVEGGRSRGPRFEQCYELSEAGRVALPSELERVPVTEALAHLAQAGPEAALGGAGGR